MAEEVLKKPIDEDELAKIINSEPKVILASPTPENNKNSLDVVEKRLFAKMIDLGIYFCLYYIITNFIGPDTKINLTISISLLFIYFSILPITKLHGTIGKIFLKLKVINQKGKQINFLQSFARESVLILTIASLQINSTINLIDLNYINLILMLILIIDSMTALLTEKNQTIHDLLSYTSVIKLK